MTSMSPSQNPGAIGSPSDQNNSGAENESNSSSRSPLANFFLKNLPVGDKKTTRDGQTPKRRGPKPDSKPAMTRRQELNRQAQRTHRERKEQYIKALEQEVIRIREEFAKSSRERAAMMDEINKLKQILAANGIIYDPSDPRGYRLIHSPFGSSESNRDSNTYGQGTMSTGLTSPPNGQVQLAQPPQPVGKGSPPAPVPHNEAMDYDQVGIDFVLTLERPCMDHMQFLMVRSDEGGEEEISGHALMATAPTASHIRECPTEPYPHKMPEGVAVPDLMKLLDLSNRLPLDGEITPIMAWAQLLNHPRFGELSVVDFGLIKEDLVTKVRCYGFGAVLEEFEVQDAIGVVLSSKDGVFVGAMEP